MTADFYAKRDELARQMQADVEAGTLIFENGWLVELSDEHTCGTGRDGYYGNHEPGCGKVPVFDVAGAMIRDDEARPLDPVPWEDGHLTTDGHGRRFDAFYGGSKNCALCLTAFNPRPGYSQNREDYA